MKSDIGLKLLLLVCVAALGLTVFFTYKHRMEELNETKTPEISTQAPTQEETEAPTVESTEKETEEPTEEPTEEETEQPTEPVNTEDVIALSSLYEKYADKFLIGTIYANATNHGNGAKVVFEHFNAITPENLLKPDAMQPTEGNFNFSNANAMMNFAQKHDLAVIGHTFCWHQQSGNFLGYVDTREEAIEQLRTHIQTVAGKYAGQITSWDVCNEIIADGARLGSDGDWTKCLRKNQWYESIGPDYVALAFQFAHEADPNAKLYYNDYNLNEKNKADAAAAMVRDLIAQGVPIHGIGMQGHYNTGTSIAGVEYSLALFSKIEGIEISITELDVTVNAAEGQRSLTEEQEIQQAVVYAKLFQLYNKYADKIARVTFWGLTDGTSWRSDRFPCLFNNDYTPKEAVYAILDPETYLELHAQGYGNNMREAEASYGTPVIDGVIDPIWDDTKEYQVNTMITAWNGATGTVKMLWDENYLYVLATVTDGNLSDKSKNAYEQDSVEIFLDQNFGRTGFYEEDDGQYRVNFKGKVSFGSNMINDVLTESFQGDAVYYNNKYVAEFAIPWVVDVKEGSVVGFDAQINDANVNGTRDSIAKFSDPTDNSWSSTENYGKLKLVK